jgi:hypothetical protein
MVDRSGIPENPWQSFVVLLVGFACGTAILEFEVYRAHASLG